MPEKSKLEGCKEPIVKRRNYFTMAFAALITVMVGGYIYGVTFCAIPEANMRIVDTTLGFLLGSVISPIIIWAFRSSKAQIDKENAEMELNQLTEKGGKVP